MAKEMNGGEEPGPFSIGRRSTDQLAKPSVSTDENGSELCRGADGAHRRLQSEEPESQIEQNAAMISAADNTALAHNHGDHADVPDDGSEDEGPPVTMSTAGRPSFNFLPQPRKTKSKKSKRIKTAVSASQSGVPSPPRLVTPIESNSNVIVSSTTQKLPSAARKTLKAKVKGYTKNGITYRSLNDPRLQSDSSRRLPPKADGASVERRKRLLLRKRAHEARRAGSRPKFVTMKSK